MIVLYGQTHEIEIGTLYPESDEEAEIERVEIAKEECLVIEDTKCGVTTAKAAGLTCFTIPIELSKDIEFI